MRKSFHHIKTAWNSWKWFYEMFHVVSILYYNFSSWKESWYNFKNINTKHLYESEKLFSCLTLKKMNVFGMFLEIIWWNGNSFVNLRIFWLIFISFSIQVERFIFKRKNSPFIAIPAQHGLHLHTIYSFSLEIQLWTGFIIILNTIQMWVMAEKFFKNWPTYANGQEAIVVNIWS